MKISIIGTGNMGRALGLRYAALGYQVFFAGRDPSGAPKRAAEAAEGGARSGAIDDAAEFGDVIVWTTRERDPSKVFADVSAIEKLDGKVIIDLNNRDYANEVLGKSRWFDQSLGEVLQRALPKTQVVKAYNTVAMEVFNVSAEQLRKSNTQMFIGGGNDQARKVVEGLNTALGFDSVDLGEGTIAMRSAEALGDVIRFLMISGGKGSLATLGVRLLPGTDLDLIGEREVSKYH